MPEIKTVIRAEDKASKVFGGIGGSVVAMNQGLQLMGSIIRGLSAPFKAVISEGMEFTSQMDKVKSISKMTAGDFQTLSDKAEQLGRSTQFTATQAGEAMEALTRAGMDVNKTLSTTEHVMNLAAAQGMELGRAADLVAVQMNVFKDSNLTAEKAVNLLNKTAGASPQTLEDLSQAVTTAGGTAAGFGMTFGELTQILGAMAESGYKSEKAGTALNAVLARLAAPTKEVGDALSKYGITLDQVNPASNKFSEIVSVLNRKNVEQADLFKILGREAAPKFFDVIKRGGVAITGFKQKQEGANTALESAKIRMDNLEGDTKLFTSALSGLQNSIFKGLEPALRAGTQAATSFIGEMTEIAGVIAKSVVKYIGYFLVGLGQLMQAFGEIAGNKTVVAFFGKIKEAVKTLVNEGIIPVIQKIKDFIKEFIRIVTENENVKKAIQAAVKYFGSVIEVLGKVATVIFKVIGKLIELATQALEPLLDAIAPVITALYKFSDEILQKYVIPALDDLMKAIDNFSMETIKKAIGTAKIAINGILTKLGEWIDLIENFTMDTIKSAIDMVLAPIRKLAEGFEWVKKAAFWMVDELTGHSVDTAVNTVGESMVAGGKKVEAFGQKMIDAANAAKKASTEVKKVNEEVKKTTAAGAAGAAAAVGAPGGRGAPGAVAPAEGTGGMNFGLDLGVLGDVAKLGKDMGNGFLSMTKEIGKSLGNAMVGLLKSGLQSIIGKMTEQEDVQKALKEVSDGISKVIAPVAKMLVPFIKKIGGALVKIVSAFMPIIETIISRLGPVIVKMVEDLLPTIMVMLEALLPVVNMILDIIIPILEELTPLIEAIMELIIELMPLIEMVLYWIKQLMPIIKAAIRIITAAVKIVTMVVSWIKKVIAAIQMIGQFVENAIKAGIAIAIAPLLAAYLILKPIFETLRDVLTKIRDFFSGAADSVLAGLETVMEALETAIDALLEPIEALIDALGGGIGGIGDAVGGIGGAITSGIKGIGSALGFAEGGVITPDRMLTKPDSTGHGLISAAVGETIVPKGGGTTINISIGNIDGQDRIAELRQTLEELFLSGRLAVA